MSRHEARVRVGTNNDEYAGIVRDRAARRFRDSVMKVNQVHDTDDSPDLDRLVDDLLNFLYSPPSPERQRRPALGGRPIRGTNKTASKGRRA